MKKISLFLTAAAGIGLVPASSAAEVIVSTPAYTWAGDTVYQHPFKAWAETEEHIVSDYSARPGYFMPIEKEWKRKNDLSAYPRLEQSNKLHTALYNMALDEMVNNVEPDTTLRTGKEWAGVWTRDVSYSIILSMAALQPEASMVSLLKKIGPDGQIIQDTGSGGAWPVSTDRMVWVLAAWEVYKVSGSKAWLQKIFPVVERSLAKDKGTVMSENGLVKGETSFIDWREQSHPRWMQTADISQTEAMSTNVMYAAALKAASEMARELGKKKISEEYGRESRQLAAAIDKRFWMEDKGYYGMYTYGRDEKMLNPRAETLGQALAIIYGIAPDGKVDRISASMPLTPYGPPVFYPQISDMPNYHNNALWPFVASYWALAQAEAKNEEGVNQAIGSVFRPATLFATNKENLNLDNGDIFTELNSSNMLWSLSGNLALTQRILFGIKFEPDGLLIEPFVPEAFSGERTLSNFPYRGKKLTITVKGYGAQPERITVNGNEYKVGEVIPASKLKGENLIVVEMDNRPIKRVGLNTTANLKTPLTPVTRLTHDASLPEIEGTVMNVLEWNPIEYIAGYDIILDGKKVGHTRQTRWPLTQQGHWQVIGVDSEGTESFASEPLSNRSGFEVKPERISRTILSDEACYLPTESVEGYTGEGFAETDHNNGTVHFEVNAPRSGDYTVEVVYSNGNGPVNTENKCAVRAIYVNAEKAGTVVMPQRGVGNWNDWGKSNLLRIPLRKGANEIELRFDSDDENMNLKTNHALVDRLRIEKIAE